MSTNSAPSDNVYMEFLGPVPGILGPVTGLHVVIWAQCSGGAGFTRPSEEEREYYAGLGQPVPEWQCEYCDFNGVTWPEATLAVEFWRGRVKLRSLVLAGRKGRREAEVLAELPELDRFLHTHNLAQPVLALNFNDSLLRAAHAAGVITLGLTAAVPPANSGTRFVMDLGSWWRRTVRRVWPRGRAT